LRITSTNPSTLYVVACTVGVNPNSSIARVVIGPMLASLTPSSFAFYSGPSKAARFLAVLLLVKVIQSISFAANASSSVGGSDVAGRVS
jgi:hypothetical protein